MSKNKKGNPNNNSRLLQSKKASEWLNSELSKLKMADSSTAPTQASYMHGALQVFDMHRDLTPDAIRNWGMLIMRERDRICKKVETPVIEENK